MKYRNRFSKVTLVCSAIILSGLATPARADLTYSFTGQGYEFCTGTYVFGCNADHLNGTFVTTVDLDNETSYTVPLADLASYSFSDQNGLTLTQSNSTLTDFAFTTDQFGDIEYWEIRIQGSGSSFIETSACLPTTCPGGGRGGTDGSGTSALNSGFTGFEPVDEVWTLTPEVSNTSLVGTGLLVLGGLSLIRRRSRAANSLA